MKEEKIINKLKALSVTTHDMATAQKRFYGVISKMSVTALELAQALNAIETTK